MSKDDTETLNLCKTMMERGEWPPLMVVFDPREGWVFFHAHSCVIVVMLQALTVFLFSIGIDSLWKQIDAFEI